MDDEYRIEIVLAGRKEDFILDFMYSDIHRDLERANILPLNDLIAIKLIENEKEKIEKLFFMLTIKSQHFDDFLRSIRIKYEWLADKIQTDLSLFNQNNENNNYYEQILNLRTELPKHVDLNVHRSIFLWEIRQKLLELERHQYVVVHGSLSYGKRWIVMDACCSYSVMDRMKGQIFWLNCAKCKTSVMILQLMEKLAILSNNRDHTVTNYKDINNKIIMQKENLRQGFEKSYLRDCLIVLIDVQNYETISAFNINCKVLITTRDKRLLDHLSNSTHKIEISTGFTRDESLELFSKVLSIPIDKLPQEAVDLHHICKSNPFYISLIANNLKEYTTSPLIRWSHWKKIFQNNESTRYDEFRRPIEQSLKSLHPEYKELFKSLVIFTDNVNIPTKVLQLYWKKRNSDVEEIVRKFDKLYLLSCVTIHGEMYCSLHYHYFSYLTNLIDADRKHKMHETLVNSYKIPEALENRLEPNIIDLPNDGYFHFYIGYHLKESGMRHLFPKLYFDFGFLEQKLRYTELPNTLGDLNTYKDEIAGTDVYRKELLEELTDFLANIEAILKTEDTCLLQYALTTDNKIKVEALKQAKWFPNRIWFDDIDHSVKYRQMVKLPAQPQFIRFIEPNSSLVAFPDNSILLTDMSSEYTVEPTLYIGHRHTICDIQIFLEYFFISLDVGGLIKIWSLKETAIERRRTSRTNNDTIRVGARQNMPLKFDCALNANNGLLLQTIDNPANQILCFRLQNHKDSTNLRIFVATKNGKILLYQWNDTKNLFEEKPSQSFETHMKNIQKIIYIPRFYIMTISGSGLSDFFSLKDHSKVPRTSPLEFPLEPPINVHQFSINRNGNGNGTAISLKHVIIIVYCDRIFKIKITEFSHLLSTEVETVYQTTNEQNFITCSVITDDFNYLMLGTKKGIIVCDPQNGQDILRSSISDNITCIDVCSLDGLIYKYILLTATKKGDAVMNIHGIEIEKGVVQWACNKIGSPLNGVSLSDKENDSAWLMGGKTFDVHATTDGDGNVNDDNFVLVVADSARTIHCKNSIDKFNKTVTYEMMNSAITNISIGQQKKLISCENGVVYEFGNENPILRFNESVDFLKFYDKFDIVIAGTKSQYKILLNRKEIGFDSALILTTIPYKNQFIILVNMDCSFDVFNFKSMQMKRIKAEEPNLVITCTANCNDNIVVGHNKIIYIFKIDNKSDAIIHITRIASIEINKNDTFKSMAMTECDSKLLAIGYQKGTIDLYDINHEPAQLIQRLESHTRAVNVLRFSPWHKDTPAQRPPIILVSMSEEICFWNITHAMNNPLDQSKLRLSQRFNRKTSTSSSHPVVAITSNNNNNNNNNNNTNGINTLTIDTHSNGNATNGIANGVNESTLSTNCLRNSVLIEQFDRSLNISTDSYESMENPWIGKTGSSEKPELLSCIKFVGSLVEKLFSNKTFTTFITIDNEGEIYYLNVKNLNKQI